VREDFIAKNQDYLLLKENLDILKNERAIKKTGSNAQT